MQFPQPAFRISRHFSSVKDLKREERSNGKVRVTFDRLVPSGKLKEAYLRSKSKIFEWNFQKMTFLFTFHPEFSLILAQRLTALVTPLCFTLPCKNTVDASEINFFWVVLRSLSCQLWQFSKWQKKPRWCILSFNKTWNWIVRATASSIKVTLAKCAVFGIPRHLMPWAWRHSWAKIKIAISFCNQ